MCAADSQTEFVEQLLAGLYGCARKTCGFNTGIPDVGNFSNRAFIVGGCGFSEGVKL